MLQGTVKRFNNKSGWGFVGKEDGAEILNIEYSKLQ